MCKKVDAVSQHIAPDNYTMLEGKLNVFYYQCCKTYFAETYQESLHEINK